MYLWDPCPDHIPPWMRNVVKPALKQHPLFLDPETFTFFHGRSPLEHKNTLLNEIAEEALPFYLSFPY